MQIFVFLQPMWCQEWSGLSGVWTFQPQGGLNRKKKKKHEVLVFKPLLQEIWLKNLTSRTFLKLQHLSFKKEKKKNLLPKLSEMERNWIMITPQCLSKIFDRYLYVTATWNSHEKIKSTIPCEQNHVPWLVKNGKPVFSKLMRQIYFFVSGKQVSRQANTWPLAFLPQIFKYFPVF